MKPAAWHVYILKCGDGTFYTGVTNGLMLRLAAHASGKGAKYTRGRGPLALVWKRRMKDRGMAQRLEAAIKRLPRAAKKALIDGKARARL